MNPFTKLWELLDGKKWYIGVVAESIAVLAYHWGFIDENTFKTISIVCGAWFGIAFRSTMAKQQTAGTPGQSRAIEATTGLKAGNPPVVVAPQVISGPPGK